MNIYPYSYLVAGHVVTATNGIAYSTDSGHAYSFPYLDLILRLIEFNHSVVATFWHDDSLFQSCIA